MLGQMFLWLAALEENNKGAVKIYRLPPSRILGKIRDRSKFTDWEKICLKKSLHPSFFR